MSSQESERNGEEEVVLNHEETAEYILMFKGLLLEIKNELLKFLEGGGGYTKKREVLYFLRLVENQEGLSSAKINNLWDLVFSGEVEVKREVLRGKRSSSYGANIDYDGCADVDGIGFPHINLIDFNRVRYETY